LDAFNVTGRKGSKTENFIFEEPDFTNKKGYPHGNYTPSGGQTNTLAGNVCGIYIRARTNKNNPGPTLCEDLHHCKQCRKTEITKNWLTERMAARGRTPAGTIKQGTRQ